MNKSRLEAFSDGVIAILITILVLDLKVPKETTLDALKPLFPVFLTYALSFIYLGIYWNNHHHMLQLASRINGKIMWANLHLLFWLSLFPFMMGWLGEDPFAPIPTAFYGFVLLMAAIAYYVLQTQIIEEEGSRSKLAAAIGNDWKGRVSPLLYILAIGVAFVRPWISQALYVLVALIWVVPDKRIEITIRTRK